MASTFMLRNINEDGPSISMHILSGGFLAIKSPGKRSSLCPKASSPKPAACWEATKTWMGRCRNMSKKFGKNMGKYPEMDGHDLDVSKCYQHMFKFSHALDVVHAWFFKVFLSKITMISMTTRMVN